MLLNIGPKDDGGIQSWQAKIMERIGKWMKKHGESIYGCGGEWQLPFNSGLAPWITTRKRNILYMHLIRYPGESFSIANLHDYWLKAAEILDTGKELKIIHEPTRDIITGLPRRSPDDITTVVKLIIRYKRQSEQNEKRIIALDDPESILKIYV